eukprot:CAMPEP_0184495042 /NCGR_PEP_ID=MMETSP0113_2-20130426/30232_1 /TAXON_ID=91329 /ORGANISM="Norrisiella sphaerica, Strain BC52" /LENGTH=408 /DNA_ID=CAMNT_0026881063 /DNA_START=26 /DNA_END=1252 /DNA_ORIENTATION=-
MAFEGVIKSRPFQVIIIVVLALVTFSALTEYPGSERRKYPVTSPKLRDVRVSGDLSNEAELSNSNHHRHQDPDGPQILTGKSYGGCNPDLKEELPLEEVLSVWVSDDRTNTCAAQFKEEMKGVSRHSIDANPTVAVCMVGNARTLTKKGVYRRIFSNFLKPLSKRAVLFVHLKTWDTKIKEQPKHGGFRPVPVTEADLLPVFRHLSPVWVHLERNKPAEENPSGNPKCPLTSEAAERRKEPDFYVGEYQERFLAQMKAMSECYSAVEKFEKDSNVTFDAIAKIRPDVTWFLPVFPATELIHLRDKMVTHLADQFIFAPRRYADGLNEFWVNYTNCQDGWEGAHLPENAYQDGFVHLGATYWEDRRTPQVIRRIHKHEPSAAVACGRQRRVTNVTRCLELVYDFDDIYS